MQLSLKSPRDPSKTLQEMLKEYVYIFYKIFCQGLNGLNRYGSLCKILLYVD